MKYWATVLWHMCLLQWCRRSG